MGMNPQTITQRIQVWTHFDLMFSKFLYFSVTCNQLGLGIMADDGLQTSVSWVQVL